MNLPTHTPDPQSQLGLVFLLLSLFPNALGGQWRAVVRRVTRNSHPDLYVFVLAAVVAGDAHFLGWTSLFESVSRNAMWGVVAGVSAGIACIVSELLFLRKRGYDRISDISSVGSRRPAVSLRRRSAAHKFTVLDLVLIAMLEECIYRHYLPLLLLRFSPSIIFAGAASSVAYGLMHYEYFGEANVVPKTVSGGILFVVSWTIGSLLAAIVGHLILNIAAYSSTRSNFAGRMLRLPAR